VPAKPQRPRHQDQPPPGDERADVPRWRALGEILEAHPDGFVLVDRDGRLAAHNDRAFGVWGLSREDVARVESLGATAEARAAYLDAVAGKVADPGAFRASVLAIEARVGTEVMDQVPLADGRVVERYFAPTHGASGEVSGRIGFFRDITRRVRADADLRDRARQQAAVAALGELAMCAEDLEPLLHAACASVRETLALEAAAIFELAPEDGRVFVRAVAGLDRAAIRRSDPLGELAHVEAAVRAHGSVVHDDGALAPGDDFLREHGLCCSATVLLHGRDRPFGALGAYLRDARKLTDENVRFLEAVASVLAAAIARRRAEEVVLEREREMRAVFDNALDAMLIVRDDGRIVDANPGGCALFGEARTALVGRDLRELALIVRGTHGAPSPSWAGLSLTGRISGEAEIAVPGQQPRVVEFSAIANILPDRHLAVLRDVTERRQLQTRLALADRMVSVGTLAAGVAHELNNPLAYVNANLAFVAERLRRLQDGLAPGGATPAAADLFSQLEDAMKDARDGAERMRVIIRDLKTFSRAEEDKVGPVDVRPVLESCINMAWNEIRHRARLARDLSTVAPVLGNEARLGQVFLNLIVNAAQAIPEGRAREHLITVRTRELPGGRLAVEVQDTGCGIPAENLPRIFDPFFTTKPPGVGTGLGLSICHSIVAAHGGEIEVESTVGAGSTFRVLLPGVRDVPAAIPPAPEPAVDRPRGRILVVDDEPLVGNVIQRTLQPQHDVTVVQSARAALDRIDAGERYDVLLSDLLMPEMSGMDLYRELRRRDARLARRTIFLTGGAFTPAARDFLAEERVECVEKPFELETIRTVLARKLAEE
jgi:signal transduction histidine kinase/CheY-like chemotaxis protein